MKLPKIDYDRINPNVAGCLFIGWTGLFSFYLFEVTFGIPFAIPLLIIAGAFVCHSGYVWTQASKARDRKASQTVLVEDK